MVRVMYLTTYVKQVENSAHTRKCTLRTMRVWNIIQYHANGDTCGNSNGTPQNERIKITMAEKKQKKTIDKTVCNRTSNVIITYYQLSRFYGRTETRTIFHIFGLGPTSAVVVAAI